MHAHVCMTVTKGFIAIASYVAITCHVALTSHPILVGDSRFIKVKPIVFLTDLMTEISVAALHMHSLSHHCHSTVHGRLDMERTHTHTHTDLYM